MISMLLPNFDDFIKKSLEISSRNHWKSIAKIWKKEENLKKSLEKEADLTSQCKHIRKQENEQGL